MSQSILQNSSPSTNSTFLHKIHQYLSSLKITTIPNPLKLIPHIFLISTTLHPPSPSLHRAESSFHTLQGWYNSSSGLYSTTGWWNSANLLTTIANLASLSPSLAPQIESILENSFVQAPLKQNSQSCIVKSVVSGSMLIETSTTRSMGTRDDDHDDFVEREDGNGFLNNYYDDEGWWALAWIQAYDLTSEQRYLVAAIDIFEDMKKGQTTPCGGIWWDKTHTYVNAIANELFLAVAGALANRVYVLGSDSEKGGRGREGYLEIAKGQWDWFERSGMVNEEGSVDDGLEILGEGRCRGNGGTVWSYNQGVVLGGLVELWDATGERRYLDKAVGIAEAAIKRLARGEDGVLRDVCEASGCGADGVQFKGVFLRGLMRLLGVLREGQEKQRLERFVEINAESIWENDRNKKEEMGVVWSGPLKEVNAGSHGSALDALVADAFVEKMR